MFLLPQAQRMGQRLDHATQLMAITAVSQAGQHRLAKLIYSDMVTRESSRDYRMLENETVDRTVEHPPRKKWTSDHKRPRVTDGHDEDDENQLINANIHEIVPRTKWLSPRNMHLHSAT